MPRGEEFTTKFKVDISDLKQGLKDAGQQIKLADAQFKAATAGMDDWRKSTDGLKAKLTQLDSTLDAQKSKLQNYTEQLKRQQDAYTENGKRIEQLKAKLKELADQGVSKTSEEYKKYENALAACQKEQDANEKAVDRLKIQILEQEAAVGKTEKEIRNYTTELDDLEKESSESADNVDDLNDSLKDTDDAAKEASDGFTVMKGALADLVANGIRMAIDAIKDFAKETLEVGKTFDKSMSNVAALSGATAEELQMLRDTAKEYGASTQFSASEAADALGYMALAGWDAEQSASALGGVLNLAAASGMDLAEASDMVTDYMSAFGLEASKSAYFSDLLAYAQANANTTAQGLGEAFQNSAANMNAAGQDIETVVSLLSMMANQGLKGSRAGTALTAVMRDMTNKMKDGAIKIGETNVQVMDSEGNFRDLTDILLDVEAATKGMGDAQKATALSSTFTADSIKGLNLLLNAGVGEAAAFEEELRAAGGAAEKMAAVMNDNLNGDLTALNSKLEGVQIQLYEKIEPALRSGVEILSKLLDGLSWLIDHGEVIGAVLAGMATALGAYLAYTTTLQIMEKGFQSLAIAQKAAAAAQKVLNLVMSANPIGLVIAAIGALIAIFAVLWNTSEDFRNFFIGIWDSIKETVSNVWKGIKQGAVDAWNGIKGAWQSVKDWFKTKVVDPISNFFKDTWQNLMDGAKNAWEGIKNVFTAIPNWFKEKFSDAWQKVKDVFSTGGKIFDGIKEGITAAFKNVVNAIIRGINKVVALPFNAINDMLDTLRGITILGLSPFSWLGSLSVPQIPELARGGVLKRGQVGLLEGKGAEAVVPLERNKAWVKAVADDMREEMTAGSVIGNTPVNNNRSVSYTQIINAPKQPSRIELYRHTRNLLSYATGGA